MIVAVLLLVLGALSAMSLYYCKSLTENCEIREMPRYGVPVRVNPRTGPTQMEGEAVQGITESFERHSRLYLLR
ncbi:hypothetical protein ANCCAN_06560 [Ancylostoma caninum]|uniref:Uncharacterized protein n=1 Tax=Ancylostoma caninum TaxID=29170 RepID=A0A368GSX5_ANCCA|nr:hypothetical protein ANCCAN_06560 [Ancylostoma caninum]